MGHFYNPPQPFVGGKQPLQQQQLPADLEAARPLGGYAETLVVMVTILASWQPGPPMPTPQHKLPPSALAVPANQSPGEIWHDITTLDDPPLPQRGAMIAALIPAQTSVPVGNSTWNYVGAPIAWQAPPQPIITSAKLPQSTIVAAADTPSGALSHDILVLSAPPPPQRGAAIAALIPPRVDNPPFAYKPFTWTYSAAPNVTSIPAGELTQAIDNPPFARKGELGSLYSWWQAPPQPFIPQLKIPQGGTFSEADIPTGAMSHDVVWFAGTRLPQTGPKLVQPFIQGQADNPQPNNNRQQAIVRTVVEAWQPQPYQPQFSAKLFSEIIFASGGSKPRIVVDADPPLPQVSPKLAQPFVSAQVDNPPIRRAGELGHIYANWLTPPPLPQVSPKIEQAGIVDTPFGATTNDVVPSYVMPRLPQVGPKLVQPFIFHPVDNPQPRLTHQAEIIDAWLPPPPPILRRVFAPVPPPVVNNPPPNGSSQQMLVCSIIAAWNETAELRQTTVDLPAPEQIPFSGGFPRILPAADTGALPQVSKKLPQPFVATQVDIPYGAARYEVLPVHNLSRLPQVSPKRIYVNVVTPVDQPPGAWAYDINTVEDPPLPQRTPPLPPVVTAVQVDKPLPQQRTNMPTILSAWIPPAPTLQIKVYAPLPSIAVNVPYGAPKQDIVSSHVLPRLPQVAPKLVQTFVPPPPDNPTPNARQQVIVRSIVETWQPPWYQPQQAGKVSKPDPVELGLAPLQVVEIDDPPLPQVSRKLPQGFTPPPVDSPNPNYKFVSPLPLPVPMPQIRGLLSPALLLNPAVDTPYGAPKLDVVASHVLPRLPQQSPHLPVSVTAVRVDNPPVRRWGAQDQIVQQWQPPPPQAPLGGLINPVITNVRVDNPPPHDGRAQRPAIEAWAPLPPQPQTSLPVIALIPQPPPPPVVLPVGGGGKLPAGGYRKRRLATSIQKAPVVAIQAPAPTPLPPSNLFTVAEAPQPSHPFISELEPHLSALRGDIMQAHHALDEQDAMDILHHLSSPAQPPAAPETSHATDEEDALAILKTLGLG
jgi:hypothetical protein